MAWGVTTASCTSPPIQIAAAATCRASSPITSGPRPGSPACPEMPGAASAQAPAIAAGTASTAVSRRLTPTVA